MQDVLDEVVDADRHAAGRDDDVGHARGILERASQRVADIGNDAEIADVAATLLDRAPQREPVGVVDLAGAARHAWLGHFVAGRHQRDPWAPAYRELPRSE